MTKRSKSTALQNKEGVSQSEITNKASIDKIKQKRKAKPSTDQLINRISNGDVTALSMAITLVESSNPDHLLQAND
ncbi:MAG: methylmalonyl Co-A mutase-associated GTPase MeaB, partial [Psychroserpens sp.]|nr:methylmalonyl Co-A mutase-associated GTPase MeaB [Psychroserpens sp.]